MREMERWDRKAFEGRTSGGGGGGGGREEIARERIEVTVDETQKELQRRNRPCTNQNQYHFQYKDRTSKNTRF